MFGEKFDLTKDEEILKIHSPKASITGGPYVIVFKDCNERWVIVALKWDKQPRLGIRWFWSKNGFPSRGKHALWMVTPPNLSNAILNGLPLAPLFRNRINDFLSGSVEIKELKLKNS